MRNGAQIQEETKMEKLSFMAACKKVFGALSGQTNLQFAQEVRALTEQDRADLTTGFAEHYSIEVTNA
jgi:hypothetical protein